MSGFRVDPVARHQIDEIYDYSRRQWGAEQAARYVGGLFEQFRAIAERRVTWRPIPAGFGVAGFFLRYERHFIYWREGPDEAVAIFSVLHVKMQQSVRLSRRFED